MSTLREVVEQTRGLLDDPDGEFATDELLIPKINLAQLRVVSWLLSEGSSPFSEEVLDLPDQPAGTTDFRAAVGPGQPWDGLHNPIFLEVKAAGSPVEEYREVPFVTRLPNVSPISNSQPGILPAQKLGAAEWRSNFLYMTPLDFDFDARLRGDFRPAKLIDLDDPIRVHLNMAVYLPFAAAVLVGMSKGGSIGPQWVNMYTPLAEEAKYVMANDLQKQVQGTTVKFARPRRYKRWF